MCVCVCVCLCVCVCVTVEEGVVEKHSMKEEVEEAAGSRRNSSGGKSVSWERRRH